MSRRASARAAATLKARQTDFDKSFAGKSEYTRPGSQNPRQRNGVLPGGIRR